MRINPAMKKDKSGIVVNPLRAAVACRLEQERLTRNMTHKDLVELLRQGTPDGKFSYGTYIKTLHQKNNVTLKTLDHMASTLDIAIADFLYGGSVASPWLRQMNMDSIRKQLSKQLSIARAKRRMHRYELAKFIGIAEATYFKLERGTANVTVDTIAVIAQALDQKPLEFLFASKDHLAADTQTPKSKTLLFQGIKENEPKQRMTVYVSEKLAKQLKVLAILESHRLNDYLAAAIEEYAMRLGKRLPQL